MANYEVGETVICSITVKDSSGTAQDPATSMNIVIKRRATGATVVASVAMTDDAGDGAYHYDCATSGFDTGDYDIIYTATDGTRVTIQTDSFHLS